MYPWPIGNADLVLSEALDIAMDYLEYTGQADPMKETQDACAHVILDAWKSGVKHRIRLANYAINAIEKPPQEQKLVSFYPRVG
jgi:hypothetical protein